MSKNVYFPRRFPLVPLKDLVGIVNSCDFVKRGLSANTLTQSMALSEIGCIYLQEKDSKKRSEIETFFRNILRNKHCPSILHFITLRVVKSAKFDLSEKTLLAISAYEQIPEHAKIVQSVNRWL